MAKIEKNEMQFLEQICQAIFDKNGFNILSLDLRNLSSMTDFYVIAEGNVHKHVQALAKELSEHLDVKPGRIEGFREGDWVVVDFGNVVVHLFIPEMRDKYALEQLWRESQIIDVPIKTA